MADPEETEVDAETKEALADELLYGQVTTDNERLRGIEAEIQTEIAGFGLDPEAVFTVESAISIAVYAAAKIWGPKWAVVVGTIQLGGMVLDWFGLDTEMSVGEIVTSGQNDSDDDKPAAAIPVQNAAQAEVAIRSEAGTLKNADDLAAAARDVATKAGVTEEQAQFEVQQAMSQQVGEMQYGQDDPRGSTTSLLNDAFVMNTMKPGTFAFNTAYLPYDKGGVRRTRMNKFELPGMLGTEDVAFYAYRPQVMPGTGLPRSSKFEDVNVEGLRWEVDPNLQKQGFEFNRIVEQDVPVTVSDVMAIYDEQPEESQRLIAQGLALGDGITSWTYGILGDRMYTDPDAIYDRDVVQRSLMNMSDAAVGEASRLLGGFSELDDRFIPKGLDAAVPIENFQNDLFDQAVKAGRVAQINRDHGRQMARDVLIGLTGRRNVGGFMDMVDQWTKEIQLENIGVNITGAEFEAGITARALEAVDEGELPEVEAGIAAVDKATAGAILARAMAQ